MRQRDVFLHGVSIHKVLFFCKKKTDIAYVRKPRRFSVTVRVADSAPDQVRFTALNSPSRLISVHTGRPCGQCGSGSASAAWARDSAAAGSR